MKNGILRWGKKFIVLLVVFLLIIPADLPAKKKKGSQLKIIKKDGEIINGELIQVKEKSLLLMTNSETGVTVDINDVSRIRIIKKSKVGAGIGYGTLIGGVSSIPLFFIIRSDAPDDSGALVEASIGAVICTCSCILIGAIVGAVVGTDKKIQVEGKSQGEIHFLLKKLKKKARIKF